MNSDMYINTNSHDNINIMDNNVVLDIFLEVYHSLMSILNRYKYTYFRW